MASASVSTTKNYDGRKATLTIEETSYSIIDNTSTITWTLKVEGGSVNYYNAYEVAAYVNGTAVWGPTSKTYDTKTFPAAKGTKTGTVVIQHKADGSADPVAFAIRGSFYNNNPATVNGTALSLTTIPRASSVSINSSNVTTNSSYTITVTPAVENTFSHILKYSFGNASGTIASLNTSSTSYSWQIPRSLAAQIPNSTESSAGALVITCETYNGSTLVGSKTCSCKLIVDSGIIPSLSSSSIQDGNATVRGKKWNIYLQNMSYVNINTMSGSGSQGSTIASYWCTFEGTNYSSTSLSGLNSQIQARGLPTTGNRTLQLWVVDSRGRLSTKASKSYTVVAYSSPSINSYDAYRSNSSGTATDDGTYFRYALNCSISSCNSKNPFTVNIRWKVKGSSTDTGSSKIKKAVTTEASYNSSGTLGGGNIATNNTYEIIFEVSDAFSTIIRSKDISPAFELIHYHASGYAVAFGKKSSAGSNQRLFEVGMPATFHDVTKFYNLINSIQEGTGANHPSRIRFIGNTTYNKLPGATSDTETCCKALLKWVCNTYPNDTYTGYIGTFEPNAQGLIFLHIYSNSDKNSDGLPNHATCLYLGYGGYLYSFGTSYFDWYFSEKSISKIAVKDENNYFTTSQSITGDFYVNGKTSTNNLEGWRLTGNFYYTPNDIINSFQTGIFGSNSNGGRLKPVRWSGTNNNYGMKIYSPGIAVSTGDTHMYLSAVYDEAQAWIGAGSSDKLNWAKQVAWKDDVSFTSGNITFSKSSGNGNMLSGKWWKFGRIMYLEIVFKTNGGSTSVGGNIWHGTVSGITLPYYRATGVGYYSGSHYIAGLYGQYNYDGGSTSEAGRLDIRALGQTVASNSDAHSLSITYIIP